MGLGRRIEPAAGSLVPDLSAFHAYSDGMAPEIELKNDNVQQKLYKYEEEKWMKSFASYSMLFITQVNSKYAT